jgi:hypothetical protein
MKTKFKIFLFGLATLFVTACNHNEEVAPNSPSPTSSAEARKFAEKAIETPITGRVDGDSFHGTLRITEFIERDSVIYAVGSITKIKGLHPKSDAVALLGSRTFEFPVTFNQASPAAADGDVQQAACDILNLDLGPLDLNILGLVVELDQVVLDITGQTGAGNLLGNLLCAITGLLNPLGNLLELLDLLNQLIDLIGSF